MSLFTQEIRLGLSNPDYVIEKVDFNKFEKANVEFTIASGTIAYINGIAYKSGNVVKFSKNELESIRTVYLSSSTSDLEINIPKFFGGSYNLAISFSPTARGEFALVGDTTIRVDDYSSMIRKYQKTMTKGELEKQVSNEFRKHILSEISSIVNKYKTNSITEADLGALIPKIIEDFKYNTERSSKKEIEELGVYVTKITLKINVLEETEHKINKLREELEKKAVREINEDVRLEEEKKRQHEIELEKAKNTKITERKEEINKTINGKEETEELKKFCSNCGKKIVVEDANFCAYCGKELK